jgi:SAM-dependent methyltransferase
VTQPFAARSLPLAVHRRIIRRRRERSEILVVGCGTGQDLFPLCATYPNAHITALDASPGKLAYAALKCEDQGLQTIEFLPGNLLDVAPLGWVFDVIECADAWRQLPDLDFGCEALARCTTRGSLLRIAIPGESTCRLAGALRASSRACGITNSTVDLKRFRTELLQGRHGTLPPALLESPDFYTLSGLRDLLFEGGDGVPGTPAWLALLDAHGFDFLCEEAGGDQARDARPAAKLQDTPASAVRDSRRDHAVSSGMQFLWFERRAPGRR